MLGWIASRSVVWPTVASLLICVNWFVFCLDQYAFCWLFSLAESYVLIFLKISERVRLWFRTTDSLLQFGVIWVLVSVMVLK